MPIKTTIRHHYPPNIMVKINITITTNLGELQVSPVGGAPA